MNRIISDGSSCLACSCTFQRDPIKAVDAAGGLP